MDLSDPPVGIALLGGGRRAGGLAGVISGVALGWLVPAAALVVVTAPHLRGPGIATPQPVNP